MIQVAYDERRFWVRISGHAGSAPKGGDVVCAAVSALGWTLLRAALEDEGYHAQYALDEEAGLLDLRCAPEPSARRRCRYLLDVFAAGLALIAERCPAYVQLTRAVQRGGGPFNAAAFR